MASHGFKDRENGRPPEVYLLPEHLFFLIGTVMVRVIMWELWNDVMELRYIRLKEIPEMR